jgi:hypothetical protein
VKTCTKCDQTKPLDAYAVLPSGNRRGACRACCSAYGSEWQRANPDRVAARNKRWTDANPSKVKDRRDRWRTTHAEREREIARASAARYPGRRHGLTPAEFAALRAKQEDLCAICHQPETTRRHGKIQRLSVDHDHACHPGIYGCPGCVRALLCGSCNARVGAVERGRMSPTPEITAYLDDWATRRQAVAS